MVETELNWAGYFSKIRPDQARVGRMEVSLDMRCLLVLKAERREGALCRVAAGLFTINNTSSFTINILTLSVNTREGTGERRKLSQSCQAEHFIYTFVFSSLLVASAKTHPDHDHYRADKLSDFF